MEANPGYHSPTSRRALHPQIPGGRRAVERLRTCPTRGARPYRMAQRANMMATPCYELAMAAAEFSLATETAERLGGPEAVGREVHCDADLVDVVEAGLPTASLRAFAHGGIADPEIATLVIKQRTPSHRRAKGERLTVDESDRSQASEDAGTRRPDIRQPRKGQPLDAQGSTRPWWAPPHRLGQNTSWRTSGRGRVGTDRLGRPGLMRLWRPSGADLGRTRVQQARHLVRTDVAGGRRA